MKKTILFASILALFSLKSNTSQAQGIALPFLETFDTTTSNTWDAWSLNQNYPNTIVHVQPVSAYGIDSGSVMINLYAAASLAVWWIEGPVFENTNTKKKLNLAFDFAAAVRRTGPITLPQDYSEDFLRVYASSDSGANYSFIDSFRIGIDGVLNTGGASPSPFNPADSQWTTISDISLPIGTNRVKFQIFRTYNDRNGNLSYLDNVDIDYCFANPPEGDSIQVDSTYQTLADLQVLGGNFKWYLDAGLSQEVTDTLTLTDSTYYYVTQMINDCESDAFRIWYATGKKAPVSIDPLQAYQIAIYPNPAQQQIFVTAPQAITQVDVLGLDGKLIKSILLSEQGIDVSDLTPGMYMLHFGYEGHVIYHKFIKE